MSSIKKRMEAKEKKNTINMLEAIIKKLKSGEFQVRGKGMWRGATEGNWIFRIIVQESEDSTINPKF